MGFLIPIFAILTGMVAIIASAYVKVQKMKMEGLGTGEKQFLLDKINQLERENAQLQARVENVETIMGGIDIDMLKIGGGSSIKFGK
jgi:uncharacterized protein YlxW (UPF0749 family)